MSTEAPPARLELQGAIGQAFGAIRRRPVSFVLLAILFGYLPSLAATWVALHAFAWAGAPTNGTVDWTATLRGTALATGGSFLIAGLGAFLGGSTTAVFAADLRGRRPAPVDFLSGGLGRMLVLYALGVSIAVAVFFGALLLIVPGVWLAVVWVVAPPVAASEPSSVFGALRRSAELTRDRRGVLLGLLVLYALASYVLILGLRAAVGAPLLELRHDPTYLAYGLEPALRGAIDTADATITAAVYFELRRLRDGVATTHLASTFD